MLQQFAHCGVVIVAGGKGLRMGHATPKQFLDLNGECILSHTIQAFRAALPEAHIVVVIPSDARQEMEKMLLKMSGGKNIMLVDGGATRFHSVQNGILNCPSSEIIFVHDGVRPLISDKLIRRCYKCALQYGSAIPAIAVTDSIRIIEGDSSTVVPRDCLRAVQTPQTFRGELLRSAFMQEYHASFTDEATVVEAAGHQVHLVEGEKINIKITTPEDLILAESLMNRL